MKKYLSYLLMLSALSTFPLGHTIEDDPDPLQEEIVAENLIVANRAQQITQQLQNISDSPVHFRFQEINLATIGEGNIQINGFIVDMPRHNYSFEIIPILGEEIIVIFRQNGEIKLFERFKELEHSDALWQALRDAINNGNTQRTLVLLEELYGASIAHDLIGFIHHKYKAERSNVEALKSRMQHGLNNIKRFFK
jgi:hypothetical protein